MKINKFKFLKVLTKHLSIKLGIKNTGESELLMMTTSLAPSFNIYLPAFKKNGIMDSEERVYIEKFEEEVKKFFTYIPVFNIPVGNITLSITKEDAQEFIKDLYALGDIEEVISLPCQN